MTLEYFKSIKFVSLIFRISLICIERQTFIKLYNFHSYVKKEASFSLKYLVKKNMYTRDGEKLHHFLMFSP